MNQGNSNVYYFNGTSVLSAYLRDTGTVPLVVKSETDGLFYTLGETPPEFENMINDDADLFFLKPSARELLAYINKNSIKGEDLNSLQNRVDSGGLINIKPINVVCNTVSNTISINGGAFIANTPSNEVYYDLGTNEFNVGFLKEIANVIFPTFMEESPGVLVYGYFYNINVSNFSINLLSDDINDFVNGAGQGIIKFKYLPLNYAAQPAESNNIIEDYDIKPITGTTSATTVASYVIPANKIPEKCLLWVLARFTKTGTGGNYSVTLANTATPQARFINLVNSGAATNTFTQISRLVKINGGKDRGFDTSGATYNDIASNNAVISNFDFNVGNAQTFELKVTPQNAGDVISFDYLIVRVLN